jgi:hypothetical protein
MSEKTESCEPPTDVNWAQASILEVVLSAEEGIPGAKAELARREKEAQELDKSADIEKNNPNRDDRGRFTFGSGGPQGGGAGGAGAAEAEAAGEAEPQLVLIEELWVTCDRCDKWRLLPPGSIKPSENIPW